MRVIPVPTEESGTLPYAHRSSSADSDEAADEFDFNARSELWPSSRRARAQGRARAALQHTARLVRQAPKFARRHPLRAFTYLFFFLCFVAAVARTIKYILDPDKERMPWRHDCVEQPWFDNAEADKLAPVDVYVGVMTIDSHAARRQVIRDTYAAHTLPRHPETGRPLGNVQVKFILGRLRKKYAHQVAMEMELYNDIVVLDIPETGSSFKTLHYFRWAAENATVPVLYGERDADGTLPVHWKHADYVLKADEDTFIMLDELERRLRVQPRTMLYWGYNVRGGFMSGELYALSHDLVRYVATSPDVASSRYGKEDTRMAHWMNLHPQQSKIHWASEHCWIYDHPRVGTPYAHGYLFPSHVQEIKLEAEIGLTSEELARRGGVRNAPAYSTTSRWRVPYRPPRPNLSAEEQIEALVEGGGRWKGSWYRSPQDVDTPQPRAREQILLGVQDSRLGEAFRESVPNVRSAVQLDAASGLTTYPYRGEPSVPVPGQLPAPTGFDHADAERNLYHERYLGGRYGGTVVVHYVKHDDWFLETAMALIGRDRLLRNTPGSAAREWRMHGSARLVPTSYGRVHLDVQAG